MIQFDEHTVQMGWFTSHHHYFSRDLNKTFYKSVLFWHWKKLPKTIPLPFCRFLPPQKKTKTRRTSAAKRLLRTKTPTQEAMQHLIEGIEALEEFAAGCLGFTWNPEAKANLVLKWMAMVISNHFLYIEIWTFWNHPIETSIYKWLALGVPGRYVLVGFWRLQYPLLYPDAQCICIFTYKTE